MHRQRKNPRRNFEDHYREPPPEFLALDSRRITRVNLEIPTTVSRLLAAHSALMARAGGFKLEAPGLDMERVKRLDAYAMALGHAHTLHLLAAKPSERLAPLVKAATELRGLLLSDIAALVQRDYLSGGELSGLRRRKGYKHLVSDLLLLAVVLRKHLPQIQGRSPVSQTASSYLKAAGIALRLPRGRRVPKAASPSEVLTDICAESAAAAQLRR